MSADYTHKSDTIATHRAKLEQTAQVNDASLRVIEARAKAIKDIVANATAAARYRDAVSANEKLKRWLRPIVSDVALSMGEGLHEAGVEIERLTEALEHEKTERENIENDLEEANKSTIKQRPRWTGLGGH